jgi:hypothetical protein
VSGSEILERTADAAVHLAREDATPYLIDEDVWRRELEALLLQPD